MFLHGLDSAFYAAVSAARRRSMWSPPLCSQLVVACLSSFLDSIPWSPCPARPRDVEVCSLFPCLPGWLLHVPRPTQTRHVGIPDLLPSLCGWLLGVLPLSQTQHHSLLVHMGRIIVCDLLPCLPGWLLCVPLAPWAATHMNMWSPPVPPWLVFVCCS